ncbi:putative NBD/HSP70 family sugar kinase [Gibbsiella quercinecans]|uniref:ROK family transcriptional regulator n=1 Tax=Gibbsiella quercinecans TaxID=929813 RepID=A0A250B023_9GAMM|nr:ROK family transcriptional regulator [Gibbsiella quercinecans]ATA19573.1 ROK family transcriptional regulator [Gibbsiella quercinecans]RLM06507.1 sugar kinase [Gibbsiella quercinecans]RLM11237.1 sugar kinase [Gibbsiella quercinecans]TCT83302.1 putative NBD/HSP70 family sugar kinase [Gibbsiella quercinecans]
MKTSGTNLEHARAHNRRVIIEAVRLYGELTRAELARLTALTPQTVSNIVAELQQAEILTTHLPRKASGRGQPAIPLTLNPVSAYSIGIHLDHQTLLIVLVDLAGEIQFRRLIMVQKPQPHDTLLRIAGVLDEIRAHLAAQWPKVLGIGVVMPGPFGVEGLSSQGPTTLNGWEQVGVAAELARLSGLPVTLENDATVAAIGERFHGVARRLNSFVYLYIGTGLGAGIFTDSHIYTGHAHNAGEIGHIVAQPGGRACYCGNHGCLERYVSLQAAYEHCGLNPMTALPDDLLDVEPALFDGWIDSALPPLRQAINMIECIFDAEAVIVGGMMPHPLLEKLIKRLPPLHQSVRSRYLTDMRVKIGMTGSDTSALGAAALPIFDEFNPQYQVLMK